MFVYVYADHILFLKPPMDSTATRQAEDNGISESDDDAWEPAVVDVAGLCIVWLFNPAFFGSFLSACQPCTEDESGGDGDVFEIVDFSCASPWEQLSADIEKAIRAWSLDNKGNDLKASDPKIRYNSFAVVLTNALPS